MPWNVKKNLAALACAATVAAAANSAQAVVFEASIDGSDAIFLAGRTDLVIPPAGVVWPGGMTRHPITPEMIQETLPPEFPVAPGDVLRVADPAVGGISFFNGFGAPFFGPDGNGPAGSNLTPFGGISGYLGPQGALTGVFLDASVPSAGPAPTLDFTPGGLGTDFTSLSPALNQVFYIGNGITSGGTFQEFTAPAGATRVVLGIPDGFAFVGPPGAYDDNDGAYRIRIGINEIPDATIPEPVTATLSVMALGALVGATKRR